MKKIYFRILAICLSLVLTFSILYKDSIQADALEWVGVAVGYDTAFKFLLGLLGVTVGVGVAEEVNWGQLRQDCTQVMIDQGASQVEASQWWADVIHGSLDTASQCWASFKSWVSENLLSDSSSTSGNSGTLKAFVDDLGITGYTLVPGVDLSVNLENCFAFYELDANNNITKFVIYPQFSSFLYRFSDSDRVSFNVYFTGPFYSYSSTDHRILLTNSSNVQLTWNFNVNRHIMPYDTFIDSFGSYPFNPYPQEWVLDGNASSDFSSVYPDIGDIALNTENADTLATDVIPLPWENIGTSDTDIESIIDDAISRVIDGTLSLENYWEYVQNITNTYAYSIENNYLLPNENGEDKKADDKVKENVENGAFVLYGLEKVFPFCIPFDIYAFITLLKADPVAPVIEYPIYNPVTQENEIITIDFSEWESVVIIFRYIFDFLLIIGLLLLARPLVGAGGDS